MGDSLPYHNGPAYLYLPHHTAIYSQPNRTGERVNPLGQHPSSFSLVGRAQPQPLHFAQSHRNRYPPLFLPQSVVQLDPTTSVPLPPNGHRGALPSFIVSPHLQDPAIERDSPHVVKKPFTPNLAPRSHLDGNNRALNGVQSSAPSMTSNGVSNMGGKREEGGPVASFARSQRPSIVSHHSNSVPSTPLQLARQYESRSRSPSPNGGLGSHSPRSVSSEANGPMPSLRKGTAPRGCKYETSAAFGRRRIPYTSSDILEKAKDEPKKTLDPHEDDKLSGDMRELYDRLLPTEESTHRRGALVKKLENILHREWPGNEFKVHVFGSSGNLLYTNESDVDVCIQTSYKRLEEMHMLAEALAKHGMEKVVCVPGAKVRIVKIWDPELMLACDMNVNNTLALENTRMIKTYVQIDDRVRLLAMIVKYWTKQRILNDAALGGTISSYTWICMILNFLQTRDPPIIPALHKLGSQYRKANDNKEMPAEVDFADDLEKLRGFGDKNTETVGQLLFQFFRRYGHEIDYEAHVISVREGRLIKREEKGWDLKSLRKEARNRLCVEEPFNTDRNLGNSADEFAWRGIHLEIRRAFDLLADKQQLDKACEQFEFPPEEKSTFFKKPTPSVKPVLTQIPLNGSRGGRGGSSHRGGRGNFNQRNHPTTGRRASSGAAFQPNRPSFLNSPPVGAMQGQEYFSRGLNDQLHDQLYQQYQLLEMQSNNLRAQLAAQQRAQQAQQVHAAQVHAHAVAQAQAAASPRNPNSTTGSPQKSPFPTGRSSPHLSELNIAPGTFPPGFLYQYPGFFDPSQGNAAMAQDGSRTNPSSPSLTHSIPSLRRTAHRALNASDTGSIRSQSQPARGVQQPALLTAYPPLPYYDPSTFAGYPIARSTQDVTGPQAPMETPYSPLSGFADTTTSSDNGTPKEYVGYYVAESPQIQPQLPVPDYSVPQIPTYSEVQRRKRVSPEITQPLLNTALRRVSRSPSPLGGHVRSYSTTGINLPVASSSQLRKDSTQPHVDHGPVIVNGSFPIQPRNRSETVDALPPVDPGNASALSIYMAADQQRLTSIEQRQQAVFEEIQRQKAAQFMRNSITNGSMTSTSPVDTNLTRVSSGGKQPFPSLPESWVSFETANGDKSSRSEDVSPTRTQAPQWRAPVYTNGLGPIDTSNAPRAAPQEIKSAGLPLLSPVFETRTPSPTASRQLEPAKLVNGTKPQSKENQHQPRRASHTPSSGLKENGRANQQKGATQNNEGSNKTSPASNNGQGTWNQPKRRKKPNKTNKQGDSKSVGEPLPANAADRKGG